MAQTGHMELGIDQRIGVALANVAARLDKRKSDHPLTIYLDAGHGGHDSGAVVDGIRESDANLLQCLTLKFVLEQLEGVRVGMSRTGDVYPSWVKRQRSFPADLAVAVHHDSKNGSSMAYYPLSISGSGYQTGPDVTLSRAFAQMLQDASGNPKFFIRPDTVSRHKQLYIRGFNARIGVLWEIAPTYKSTRESRLKYALQFLGALELMLRTGKL